jgi:hypothetical protein
MGNLSPRVPFVHIAALWESLDNNFKSEFKVVGDARYNG